MFPKAAMVSAAKRAFKKGTNNIVQIDVICCVKIAKPRYLIIS